MAAAAREPEGGKETLGLRGGPRYPYMGLCSRGWPRGSSATAAGLCERELVAALERDGALGRWQVGPEKKRRAYRFAKSPGPRGRRRKRTWAVEKKEKGPRALEGFLDFSKKKNSKGEKTFGGVLEKKKNT